MGKTARRGPGKLSAALWLAVCLALGALLVCNLVIIVRGALSPDRPPSVLGVTPMVVLSGSMSGSQEGHIETGDLIFVGAADPDELEEGDVIAYMSGGVTVTHRITAIDTSGGERLFTTKGDANEAEDAEPVAADQIVGVYLGRIPKLGDFALFLQQPLGMLLFIGAPLLAFLVYDVIRRQRAAHRVSDREAQLEAELERLRARQTSDISDRTAATGREADDM